MTDRSLRKELFTGGSQHPAALGLRRAVSFSSRVVYCEVSFIVPLEKLFFESFAVRALFSRIVHDRQHLAAQGANHALALSNDVP